jgi:hypothetical protein
MVSIAGDDIRSDLPKLGENHIAERYPVAAWDCMKLGNIACRAPSKLLH